MPLFHFHLVTDGEREHVGSVELPSRGEAVPVGLQLVTKILANSARMAGGDESLTILATDDAGTMVYSFNVSRRLRGDDRPNSYLH